MSEHDDGKKTKKLIKEMISTYEDNSGINFIDVTNLPVRDKVLEILDLLIELLFPGYGGKRVVTRENIKFIVGDILSLAKEGLEEQIELAYRHQCRITDCPKRDCRIEAARVTDKLLSKLPAIREMLKDDVHAAYDGDPAAQSFDEIVISYPCISAIATHRIAHELYLEEVPLIPRMISESAHRNTGIDIHPGARIGKHFFIDHGTGVVIGETAIIGNNVRMYHGVTLGALRFKTDKNGRLIKGGKRHPTVEDDVVISPEATILGDVTIGKGALIGSNTWVQEDVAPGVTVKMANPELKVRHRKREKNGEAE